MSFLFSVFTFATIYWFTLSLIAYFIANKAFKAYRNHPKFDVPDHYQSFIRKDFNKWDEKAIILGCFLRFPFKFTVEFSFLFWLCFLSILHLKIKFPASIVELVRINLGRIANLVIFDLEEHFDWR